MAQRRKYRKQSRVWPWVSFVLFGLIVVLLGYSVIKKESPASVLKSIFSEDLDPDDIRRLGKDQLIALANQKDSTIFSLKADLESCLLDDGFKKGVITTSSSTLNMRSKPSLESDVLLKIPTGSRVSILFYDNQELFLDGAMGQWCKIKYADKEGWIWGNYVILENR